MVRAKFKVASITSFPGQQAKSFKLCAICDDTTEENRKFAKYTPSGTLEMWVDNPPAAEVFEQYKEFYLDFIPVEATEGGIKA